MDQNDLEYIPITQDDEPYTLRVQITINPDGRLVVRPIDDPVVMADA